MPISFLQSCSWFTVLCLILVLRHKMEELEDAIITETHDCNIHDCNIHYKFHSFPS